MTQKQIDKGNILISEFLGKKFKPYYGNSSYDIKFDTYQECADWIRDSHLEKEYSPELGWNCGVGNYHKSWNDLMPAVEKIATLESPYKENLVTEGIHEIFEAQHRRVVCLPITTPITTAWESVTQFLQWYKSKI